MSFAGERTPAGARHGAGLAAMLALAFGAALGPAAAQAAAQDRGFLLRTPRMSLTVKAGWGLPRAGGSDDESLWHFTREQLTVETGDFAGFSVGGELGVRITERIDLTVNVARTSAETLSEFRGWVGEDDLPIVQTTRFSTTPLTLGVKAYLWNRGRSVGRFAWVPRRWNPYVGVAGGFVWYEFRQNGEFVDYETQDIFEDAFLSNDRAPTIHFVGGADVTLRSRIVLTGEARYAFASGPLDADFVGFSDLDLAGLQVTAGIALRF